MTSKQLQGTYAPDASHYGCLTTGAKVLNLLTTSSSGFTKQIKGSRAPDESLYMTMTNGNNTLT